MARGLPEKHVADSGQMKQMMAEQNTVWAILYKRWLCFMNFTASDD